MQSRRIQTPTHVVKKVVESDSEDEEEDEYEYDEEEEEEDEEDEEQEDEEQEDDAKQSVTEQSVSEKKNELETSPQHNPLTDTKQIHATQPKSYSLDQMTLELLVPQSKYNRHLARTDPARLDEKKQFAQKVKRYRQDIQHVLGRCLDSLEAGPLRDEADCLSAVHTDTLASFESVCKMVIHDLEMEQGARSNEMFTKCDINRYSLNNFRR